MSGYGKINLLGMLLLPTVAILTAVIVFGPRIDTLLAVFAMNAIPMLIGGLFSALLLRGARKSGGVGRWIALWPTLLATVIGTAWYVSDALFPAAYDPGRFHFAVPLYLLAIVILAALCAWGASAIVRSRRAAT